MPWAVKKAQCGQKRYNKWPKEENMAYAQFLINHQIEFECKKDRRSSKFFSAMAEELNNGRDNKKCRSHHQKMLKKYGSVENIMKELGAGEEKL